MAIEVVQEPMSTMGEQKLLSVANIKEGCTMASIATLFAAAVIVFIVILGDDNDDV